MSDYSKNKTLYAFSTVIHEDKVIEETKNENGVETTIKKTEKVETPVKIIIFRPSRRQKEEADMEYSRHLYYCIDNGIYTKQQIAKKYNDTGGDLSKPEVDEYIRLNNELVSKIRDVEIWSGKDPSTLTDEEKSKSITAISGLTMAKQDLIEFETQRAAIFDHTADQKAFYRVLSWFKLMLTHKEINGKIEPLFPGSSFEEKLDKYEELVENEDEILLNVDQKLSGIIAFWFTSQAVTQEDFKPIEEELGIQPDDKK